MELSELSEFLRVDVCLANEVADKPNQRGDQTWFYYCDV